MDFNGNLTLDAGGRVDEVILLLNMEDDDPLYVEFSNADQLSETIKKAGRVVDYQAFTYLGIIFTIAAFSPFDFQSFDGRKKIAKAVLHWILKS